MKFYQHPFHATVRDFRLYLWEKVDNKQISGPDIRDILRCGLQVIEQAGLPDGPEADDITIAVYRQQFHVMKSKLLELHPELGDEVRNWSSGRER